MVNNRTPSFRVSVLLEGKLKTFHIPAELAEEARHKVEMHKRFSGSGGHHRPH